MMRIALRRGQSIKSYPFVFDATTTHSYAKKEKVVSYKKLQHQKKEQAKQNKLQMEEKQAAKAAEARMKKYEKDEERRKKGKSTGFSSNTIPHQPEINLVKRKHIKLRHTKENQPDLFRDFINTHRNIDFNLESGIFGEPEFRTPEGLQKWAADKRLDNDAIIAKIQDGDENELFDKLNDNLQQVRGVTASIVNLHADPSWTNAAQSARESTDATFVRHLHDSQFGQLGLSNNKFSIMDAMATNKNASGDFNHSYEVKSTYVESQKTLKIDPPSLLFELPPRDNQILPRTAVKKKKYVTVDLNRSSNVILTHVTNERVRKQVLEPVEKASEQQRVR
ncbi:hypothetical protein AKO1_014420 [Acrasis kona]|uniref:Uncharacterized protein n=1 Tax=Acrasis kona TaxID=1008807 RepID=A0AAW2ZFE0_9EUKA